MILACTLIDLWQQSKSNSVTALDAHRTPPPLPLKPPPERAFCVPASVRNCISRSPQKEHVQCIAPVEPANQRANRLYLSLYVRYIRVRQLV